MSKETDIFESAELIIVLGNKLHAGGNDGRKLIVDTVCLLRGINLKRTGQLSSW